MYLYAYAHIQHKHTQRHMHKKRKRKKKRKLVTTHTSFKARTFVFIVCLSILSLLICVCACNICVCACVHRCTCTFIGQSSMLVSLQLFSILICETGLSLNLGLVDLAHWLAWQSRDRPYWVRSARNTVPTAALTFYISVGTWAQLFTFMQQRPLSLLPRPRVLVVVSKTY